MDHQYCDQTGTYTPTPLPHTCSCALPTGHESEGLGAGHKCICGAEWTVEPAAEREPFELTQTERTVVTNFLQSRDYALRMNAFSIDLDGKLVVALGRILERLL